MLSKITKLRISHSTATLLPNLLGITKPYHKIATLDGCDNGGNIYLGCILLDSGNSRLYRRYDYKRMVKNLQLGCVIRTMEPFELSTRLWGGVRAPTVEQYQALNVKAFDLSITDFVTGFTEEHKQFAKALLDVLEEVYQLQREQQCNIYFHCKAGKNRSFKSLTTYLCYLKFREQLQAGEFDEAAIRAYAVACGKMICSKRPQVIYHSNNHRQQHENFVVNCFRAAFG